ncbi:MAG: hypothetical protein ISQ32_04560 [Rickettsiales bacterium]|nr:hypothetical protein [Rickettsiales bacterium]
MTLLSYNKSQLTDEANFGIEENANKISKVSNYINIQNGLDLFSAIYLAASITFLALVSFPPIAIATLAVTLSSLCVVASINERQQISEFKKEQLMGKEILQDISKKLESKQDIADQIEQPPLQRKLSKGNSIIKTDEIQPNGQSISNIANKLSKTETKAQENSRSF